MAKQQDSTPSEEFEIKLDAGLFGEHTILCLEDIPEFLGIDINFPLCRIGQLKSIEANEFMECIGLDLYEKMLGALANYDDQKKWNNENTFLVGDVVEHCDKLYIVIKESKCISPPNKDHYVSAPKFDHSKPCGKIFETFYCKYLGPYLAHCVMINRLPHIHGRLTGAGVLHTLAEGQQVVSSKIYESKRMSYEKQLSLHYKLMQKFAEACPQCLGDSILTGDSKCSECGCVESQCDCEGDCLETLEGLNDYKAIDPFDD